jgi:uncharacterized protein GlcG (DUF336 family)
MRRLLSICSAIALTASGLAASGEASAQALSFPRPSISVEAAETMANACVAWYGQHPNPGKPAVWILNANGAPIYMKRIDGTTRIGVVTGKMKADTALYFFQSSRDTQRFFKSPTGETNPTGLVQNILLGGYPSPGGIPIVVNGAVIGAIGVGGMVPDAAHNIWPDEQCAQAGIDAAFKH